MLELFVIGTFWFWALIIAEIILLFVFIENENGIGATVSLIIFGCLLQFCGNVDLIGFVMSNPLSILAVVGAYFALGAFWGAVKWWIFCRDRKEEYDDAKAEFLAAKGHPGAKVVPVELRAEWKELLEGRAYSRGRTLADTPRVRDNKARVMRWMTFWPVSLIWSLINDFVKRVFRTIYQKIAGILQQIADNVFGSVKDDLEIPDNE
jgi:hypothetical protein